MTKGPDRRHRYGVCPNCNTEVQSHDKKSETAVCPECDTVFQIKK